jgi:hypothetical protein
VAQQLQQARRARPPALRGQPRLDLLRPLSLAAGATQLLPTWRSAANRGRGHGAGGSGSGRLGVNSRDAPQGLRQWWEQGGATATRLGDSSMVIARRGTTSCRRPLLHVDARGSLSSSGRSIGGVAGELDWLSSRAGEGGRAGASLSRWLRREKR